MLQGSPFGQWLKQRRKALDLSQEELAERIGCSDITVRKIEAGERRPSRQVAELLADLFKVPAEEREEFISFARGLNSHDRAKPPQAEPGRSPSGNLPARLTRLIGREEAVAKLRNMLAPNSERDDIRLLTLTGPPGIGKTSLALQVAADLMDHFPDGGFFVALAPINDPDLVIPTIAQALGLKESGDRPLIATLTDYLRHKRVLLALDNFEQVLDGGLQVVELLQACPQTKALITSREALHVRSEHQFAVSPLPVPGIEPPPDLESLSHYPAVELFVERAQAVNPDFALTQGNARDVAAVCIHLDGLPLAIELAAARTNILSLRELLTALDNRFGILSGGWRDLPPRHRTLRQAIGWSYDLLDEAEQTLFRRLVVRQAVFGKGAWIG